VLLGILHNSPAARARQPAKNTQKRKNTGPENKQNAKKCKKHTLNSEEKPADTQKYA